MPRPIMTTAAAALVGVVIGVLTKVADDVGVGNVLDHFGPWVVLVALIGWRCTSRSVAAVTASAVMLGMVAGYYLVQTVQIGPPPNALVLGWVLLGVTGVPLLAAIVAHGAAAGRWAPLCWAIPAAMLLAEGAPALLAGVARPWAVFDVVAAVTLLVLLPRGMRERLLAAACAVLLAPVLQVGLDRGFSWLYTHF